MINKNGTLVSNEEPIFNAGNRGFLYADRIFETIRYQNGRLLFWEDHYFRMMGGACILRMDIPIHLNMDFMEEEILKTIDACNLKSSCARIRLSLYREDGGFYLPTDNTLTYLIEVNEIEQLSTSLNDVGLSIDVFHDHLKPKQALSSFKGGNSIISVLSSIFANENGLDEAIILNSESHMCETSASNLFVVKDKTLLTPPLASGCVDGIYRKQLIEYGESWGFDVQEKDMKTFELITADEVFLTNSIKGVQWVKSYKNKTYGNSRVKEIHRGFTKLLTA